MEEQSFQAMAKAMGGKPNTDRDFPICDVSTDTRTLRQGSLFVALSGENFDGHDFLEKAFACGASAAVVSREVRTANPVIQVEDTRRAYLALAGWYRRQFAVKMAGVTGSVGKTSTKEMIYAVLSSRYKTLKTQGNFNNEIGLPRTLLGLDKSFEAAVIEMGMSHAGEIKTLAETAAPDVAVITNIGVSHIENLGSRENILKAKMEILAGLKPGGPLVINADNDLLAEISSVQGHPVVTCGVQNSAARIRGVDIAQTGDTTSLAVVYDGKRYPVQIPVVGRHNVINALLGFAVGISLGVSPEEASAAIGNYRPAGMRQNVVNRGGVTVIEDCYNASPDSMKAALDVLCSVTCRGKRAAVLGDMLELGDYSRTAHEQVGRMVASMPVELLVCVGKEAEYIARAARENGLKSAFFFADRDEAAQFVRGYLKEDDAVIFKASRGMRLEEIIEKNICICDVNVGGASAFAYAFICRAERQDISGQNERMTIKMTGFTGVITAAIAFGVTALLGFVVIPYLRKLKFGQTIKEIGPTWHKNKQGTPTMGGLMFILGIILAAFAGYAAICLGKDAENLVAGDKVRFWAGLIMALLFGMVGFLDDFIKVVKKRNLGLNAKQKTVMQLLIAAVYVLVLKPYTSLQVSIPFFGQVGFSPYVYYPLVVIGIYFIVNAVNLTDGVDGLAGSVTFTAAIIFIIATGMMRNAGMNVLATALAGGCLGFLMWNFHPAKVFMGDTGSMFLGGMVVALAFGIDYPLFLIFAGFIYIVEALSVVLQVISFKTTGKRIFKMSPIHHHFEMCHWSEGKIVTVFSVVTAVMGIIGLLSVYDIVKV